MNKDYNEAWDAQVAWNNPWTREQERRLADPVGATKCGATKFGATKFCATKLGATK